MRNTKQKKTSFIIVGYILMRRDEKQRISLLHYLSWYLFIFYKESSLFSIFYFLSHNLKSDFSYQLKIWGIVEQSNPTVSEAETIEGWPASFSLTYSLLGNENLYSILLLKNKKIKINIRVPTGMVNYLKQNVFQSLKKKHERWSVSIINSNEFCSTLKICKLFWSFWKYFVYFWKLP